MLLYIALLVHRALYTQENGVNLLSLRASTPDKYALILMDAIFDDREMSTRCFKGSARSTKPPLPQEKTKIIEGKASALCSEPFMYDSFFLIRVH
jgi:hypothetical protein